MSTTQSLSNEEQEQPSDDKPLSELKYNFDAMYTLLSSEKNNYRLEAYSSLSDLVKLTLGSNHPLVLIDYVDQALGNKFIKMKKERDFTWSIDINSEADSISITLKGALFKSQDISWYIAKLLRCGISKEDIHFQEKETNNLQGEKRFILILTNIQVLQDRVKVRNSLNRVQKAEEMLLLSNRSI